MRPETVDVYVKEADLGTARRKVIPSVHVQDSLPRATVDRLGSTLLIGRYHPKAVVYWETNPAGDSVYMLDVMHRIYLVVMAEIKADHDLSTTAIANLTGASRGYVSKVIHFLARFGFITILGVFRGRWGRTVAKLRSMFPTVHDRVSGTVGNIRLVRAPLAPEPTFDDAFYAAWDANEAKRLQL